LSRDNFTFTGQFLSIIPPALSGRRRSFRLELYRAFTYRHSGATANNVPAPAAVDLPEIGVLTCIAYTVEIKARDALTGQKSRT
jgi:hypothetical protein